MSTFRCICVLLCLLKFIFGGELKEENGSSSEEDPPDDWFVFTNSFHQLNIQEGIRGIEEKILNKQKKDDFINIKITDFYSENHLFPISHKYNTLEEEEDTIKLIHQNRVMSNYHQRHLKIKRLRKTKLILEKEVNLYENMEKMYEPLKETHEYRVYEFNNLRKKDVINFLGDDKEKNVISIEKNYKISISPSSCRIYSPSSANFGYGLDMIDSRTLSLDNKYCPDLKNQGEGSSVFVLDTGFLTSTNSIPSDINPFKIYRIFDDHYNGDYASDLNGHGTHVTSIICSSTYGVAPKSSMYILKVLSDSGSGSFANIVNALLLIYTSSQYTHGVISMSLGVYLGDGAYTSPSLTIDSLIGLLMNEKNFVVVAAAGNDGKNSCSHYPSKIPGVISVGSSNRFKSRSYFSNYGTCVSTFAPGEEIRALSILSENQYANYSNENLGELNIKKNNNPPSDISLDKQIGISAELNVNNIHILAQFQHHSGLYFAIERVLSGTSQATPFVSGYFALLRSANPNATASYLKSFFTQRLTTGQLSNVLNSPNLFLYVGEGGGETTSTPTPSLPFPPSSPLSPPSSSGNNLNSDSSCLKVKIFLFLGIMFLVILKL